jgi:hypothetical protein
MAVRRRRKKSKPRPEDRIDDLFFTIQSVKRRWSRGLRWDINTRKEAGVESSDTLEITGVSAQKNALEIERVELAIHSRDREDLDDREFLGLCDRVRGDRGLLNAYLWLPLQELMALAPALMHGQLVEVELRIRASFAARVEFGPLSSSPRTRRLKTGQSGCSKKGGARSQRVRAMRQRQAAHDSSHDISVSCDRSTEVLRSNLR